MFKKVLVANRGEIALRVIRTCRELGIPTVAVYSEADRDALHARFATEGVCIGPALASKSYLNPLAILTAAEITGADAIHPGFGFLAENAEFVRLCEQCGIKFIGPSASVISIMGDKSEAKRAMTAAGVPVAPGSDGAVADADEALAVARRVGFPVMVKASAGGGGKGMRIARGEDQLRSGFAMARAEAEAAFGDGSIYVEKFIESPKHIEIQVMGDGKGGAIHLGERDCSIQRRHQKLIEEAPGPLVDPKLREAMGKAAVEACQRLKYCGAGTIEFLVEGGNFYFMEMNTRIQVEHTVTEEITGIDLIEEMMRAAAGLGLSVKQSDVKFRGWAIECRINAEDPARNFMPTPGRLTAWHPPGGPGIRLDSHCYQEYLVPPHYDSMLGKLIAWAPTRARAIARMRRALDEFVVEGVKTTIPFHKRVLDSAAFREGTFGVDFVERHILSAP